MAKDLEIKALSVAALEVGALFLLASGVFAAPPQGRPQLPQSRMQSQIQEPQHLDLRPPSHVAESGGIAEKSHSAFPSMAHRQNLAQEQVEPPILASDGMRSRPTIQDLVHRVHREGVPVARLFETKSALLHLGLNPKGKPGLWLVQKTR
jgi:hypothetical protein